MKEHMKNGKGSIVPTWRASLNRFLNQRSMALETIRREKIKLQEAKEQVHHVQEAQDRLQRIAQGMQQSAHRAVSTVVSRCLSIVFEEPYEMRIEFDRKRGRTEAEFLYYRNHHKVDPRVTSGGVMQVAALALRQANLLLAQPPARRLLVLDEPMLGVSAANRPRVAALFQMMAEKMGMQLLIATHDPSLMIGKVIEL